MLDFVPASSGLEDGSSQLVVRRIRRRVAPIELDSNEFVACNSEFIKPAKYLVFHVCGEVRRAIGVGQVLYVRISTCSEILSGVTLPAAATF